MRHAVAASAFVLALCSAAASAQAQADVAARTEPAMPYDEWLFSDEELATRGALYNFGAFPWSHDGPIEARRARVAAYWARYPEYGVLAHGQPYLIFLEFDADGSPYAEYWSRWLAECIAGGDIVVPVASAREQQRPYGRIPDGEPRPLVFIVFAAGTPQEAVEGVIREHGNYRFQLTPEEVEDVVRTYRVLAGLPT